MFDDLRRRFTRIYFHKKKKLFGLKCTYFVKKTLFYLKSYETLDLSVITLVSYHSLFPEMDIFTYLDSTNIVN